MSTQRHIPHLKTITSFYDQLRIGVPQGDDFALMRIEDQPDSKRAEMPLFRCNFYRLVLFTSPGVEWHNPGEQFSSSPDSLYFSYPGKLESWTSSQKIHGFLVCFTENFARFDPQHSGFEEHYPFFAFNASPLVHLQVDLAKQIKQTLNLMLAEMNGTDPDRKEMLQALLHQYLILARRAYVRNPVFEKGIHQNETAIFNRFRGALDQYFLELANGQASEQASVSLLADRLHLNPSYLNTTIRKLTGTTASTHIHQKTILEAKSYLMHTDLRVAEISHQLGFTNVSYFNRFFKRHSLQTPLSFRKTQD